jgi:hypothetical protein
LKRHLAAAAAAGIVTMFGMTGVASASTVQTGSIVLDNSNISAPHKIVYDSTTYMPIWYVMRTLDKLNIQSVWNGSEWQLTTASTAPVNLANIHPGTGNVSIYVNDILVQKVASIVAVDPASGQKTTYMPIWYVMQILNRLGVYSNWNGWKWNMESPAVQVLANAFMNTEKAPYSQFTGDIHELVQIQPSATKIQPGVTPQNGNSSSGSSGSAMPTQMTIDMKIQSQSGIVNNQRAMLITITPTITPLPGSTGTSGQLSGTGPVALPSTIHIYIQGTQVWMNQGQGWQALPESQALLQKIQSQIPGSQINLATLKNIQSTATPSGYTYTAELNPAGIAGVLGPIMQSVASQASSASNVSPAQIQAILTTILSHMAGSMTIDVQTSTGQPLVTEEQMQMSMDLPLSQLFSMGSLGGSMAQASDIKVNESMSVSYTYNSTPLTPPTGLPQNSASMP